MSDALLVKTVSHEAEQVVSVTFVDPAGEDLPEWSAGAHLEITLPSGTVRQYSLCSDPQDRSRYQVAVLREAGGRGGSLELHDTPLVGRFLIVQGPRNRFALVDAPDYLFIAGGIGITPILAMLRTLVARGDATWHLYYGGRSRATMAFLDEIARLVAASGGRGGVTVSPEDETGMLDLAAILGRAGARTAVYCCGPGGLLTAVEGRCAELGLSERLHIERFSASEEAKSAVAASSADEQPFELELAKTGVTLTVHPGESMLDCVRTVVPNAPSSCESGYCGSCEVRLLSGQADHRDDILTQAEREANETVFICVSRAKSDRLVIDL